MVVTMRCSYSILPNAAPHRSMQLAGPSQEHIPYSPAIISHQAGYHWQPGVHWRCAAHRWLCTMEMFWKAKELNIALLSWPIWMAEERDCRMPPSTSSSSIPRLAAGVCEATHAEQSWARSESLRAVIVPGASETTQTRI